MQDILNRRFYRYKVYLTDGDGKVLLGQTVALNKKKATEVFRDRIDRDWFPAKMFVAERAVGLWD